MPTKKKVQAVQEIREALESSAGAILTNYRGLSVHEMAKLRRELRQADTTYKVLKNTLVRIVVQELDQGDLLPLLTGPTAIAFFDNDVVAPTKALSAFARRQPALEIKGGLVEGRVYNAAQMKALATLPPKEVLVAQLLGMLQAPTASLVRVLNGPVQGLATALTRIAEQKEAVGAA